MKEFNTTAVCIPSKHYMVDISETVSRIKKMVEEGKYFTINRARQYGKTTTINQMTKALSEDYIPISLDFQDLTSSDFADESDFTKAFAGICAEALSFMELPDDEYQNSLLELSGSEQKVKMSQIFTIFDRWCKRSPKPLVLMIDEVDSAANNQVFLDFLAKLRSCYIKREKNEAYKTFQSVILAGVTDIKHLKSKIRSEAESKLNSPWNIAADFDIDMSLSEKGIRGMLDEYEAEHHTGMDTAYMAGIIRDYTNGYPFLVSRICQLIDKKVMGEDGMCPGEAWSRRGMDEAIKMILSESNTLFDSLTKNLNNNPEIKAAIRSILMEGKRIPWTVDQDEIARMAMYGYVRNENNAVRIDNRIFETRLYNYFMSDEELKSSPFTKEGDLGKSIFAENGKLNMKLILEHFAKTYTEVMGPLKEKFNEKDGREYFLLYLKPIINGTGNYYIEAQTRDQTRTDVIVDYLGQQYIIELKIWRGERYNERGEKQIAEYLDYFGLNTGYMLSFNFNRDKETGMKRVEVGDKVLYECVV